MPEISEAGLPNLETPKPLRAKPSEPYNIRYFNPNNSGDTQVMKDADRHPKAKEFMVPPRSSKNNELDWLIRINEADNKDPRLIFAVADKNDNSAIGWIQYYRMDHPELVTSLVDIPEDAVILEVSYAKQFGRYDWGKGAKFVKNRDNLPEVTPRHVAVNGLKQTMEILKEREQTISKEKNLPPRPIYIFTFTNEKNTASEKVVGENEFLKLPQKVDYDGEMDNVWYKQI